MSFSEKEIPKINVLKSGILQHGDDITIVCKLTKGEGPRTQLKSISWYKDGVLLQTVRNPDPDGPQDFLGPLVFRNVSVRDGGQYTCLLDVLLRNVKEHNVSDTTVIRSKLTYMHQM